jgi:16S rRNA (guanine527-N7)-methyltransferase
VTVPGTLPTPVSRETQARLEMIVQQLQKWQPRINLVASSTLDEVWQRHVQDSLQLVPLAPRARRWVDLGSGGGFPGLVIAAVLAETRQAQVVLIESNAKKCAFLRETSRLAGLPVQVVCSRIQDAKEIAEQPFDVVSARALAPFAELLRLAHPWLSRGATGLFPKGRDVDDELKDAARTWQVTCDLIHSCTERDARIVKVSSVGPLPTGEL